MSSDHSQGQALPFKSPRVTIRIIGSDQVIVAVSRQAYAEFARRLDMPPKPNERLRKTMRTPAPWDKA